VGRSRELDVRDDLQLASAAAVVLEVLTPRRIDIGDIAAGDTDSAIVGACNAIAASVERARDVGLADLN
jgi:hypothetical protein